MMPIVASSASQGAALQRRFREHRQVEAQEAVGAHLQQDTCQDDRAGGGRFHVRIWQPGVQRPHRHLDGEGRGEGQEQPQLDVRQDAAVGDDLRHREGALVDAQPQDRQQHQDRARHGVQEELDRRIHAPRTAPHADQEVHRHQGEFPEDVEQEQVQRHEHTDHAHFQQQEEDHEVLDPLLDR